MLAVSRFITARCKKELAQVSELAKDQLDSSDVQTDLLKQWSILSTWISNEEYHPSFSTVQGGPWTTDCPTQYLDIRSPNID